MSTAPANSPVSDRKPAKARGAPGRAVGAGGIGFWRRVALTLIYFAVVFGLVASRRANLVVAVGAGNALIMALTATPAAGRSGVKARIGGAALGFGVTVGAFYLAYYMAYCLMFILGKLLGW